MSTVLSFVLYHVNYYRVRSWVHNFIWPAGNLKIGNEGRCLPVTQSLEGDLASSPLGRKHELHCKDRNSDSKVIADVAKGQLEERPEFEPKGPYLQMWALSQHLSLGSGFCEPACVYPSRLGAASGLASHPVPLLE